MRFVERERHLHLSLVVNTMNPQINEGLVTRLCFFWSHTRPQATVSGHHQADRALRLTLNSIKGWQRACASSGVTSVLRQRCLLIISKIQSRGFRAQMHVFFENTEIAIYVPIIYLRSALNFLCTPLPNRQQNIRQPCKYLLSIKKNNYRWTCIKNMKTNWEPLSLNRWN